MTGLCYHGFAGILFFNEERGKTMATLEELKKEAAAAGIELTEELLDSVAGGAYSQQEWEEMTVEERQAAQIASVIARTKNLPCALD